MLIKDLFERDISRPINGVVKADQLDDASVWQELDEFVITRELNGHIRKFFASYLDAVDNHHTADLCGKIGVWISGFFGSGKSHFLKVLSYLLRNQEVSVGGQSKKAVEFFDSKVNDAMLLADIKRAVAVHTDVILFNIDSKASHKGGRDAILQVFLKVLNEMQGYSPDHPHIAHMERYLDEKHLLAKFKDAFHAATGSDWEKERDAYEFNRDQVIQAFMEATGQSDQSATQWIDNAEAHFSLTVENFCKWVKGYLDSKGSDRRLIFLVDEIGQFIGTDSHLMLNLQTITEELGVTCRGRAWIVVTSQEDIDAVLGEMNPHKSNDFSKITGRFQTRLSLSSANVDEVIRFRLLAKSPDAEPELATLYRQKGDILRNQLTFGQVGMALRGYKDAEDFSRNYPLVPYQFTLLQKIFESIRKSGATGLHLARGERSILDAVQSALKTVARQEVGILVPLYHFYPAIENFLDTSVKQTIEQAKERVLEDFDIEVLKVLFLIRYVEEVKGTVDNLVGLCIDSVDTDRVALRRKIEDSLARLEKETLIARSGENYFFLTHLEQDINREIKHTELSGSEEAELLGTLIFHDVLGDQRKYRYSANKMDFDFNRRCDGRPIGNELQGSLLVSVITPLSDDYEVYQDDGKCKLESVVEGGILLVRLGADNALGDELRIYKKTEKYLARKIDGTQPEQTKKILSSIADDNRQRRVRLTGSLDRLLVEASYFANGVLLSIKAGDAKKALEEAMEYLVKNTFTKMRLLARLLPDDQIREEIAATLRNHNISHVQTDLHGEQTNGPALKDIRSYVDLCSKTSRQIVLFDMIQNRYARRPYGWPEMETALLVAQLMVLGEISLVMDGAALPCNYDHAYGPLTTTNKWRKITVIQKKTSDPQSVRDARTLGQKVFAEMGPEGEEALFNFLKGKLEIWQKRLEQHKSLADTGHYPGADAITDTITAIRPLIGERESFKFIERFNALKNDLPKIAENFQNIDHFYTRQCPAWERLRQANARFELNALELQRDEKAAAALKRIKEILTSKSPYGVIKEADGLIQTVEAVNKTLVQRRRDEALKTVGQRQTDLRRELDGVKADDDLRAQCLKPLEALQQQVAQQESLAHISQAEQEAVRAFDEALSKISAWQAAAAKQGETDNKPAAKPLRVIKPAELATQSYLETDADIEAFLEALGKALKAAISEHNRIQIR
jgi:hypothetical protein